MPTYYATNRRPHDTVVGKGDAGVIQSAGARSIEVPTMVSGSIVDFRLRIPTNVRIDGSSRISWDDLATTGSPAMNLGLYAVDGNTTDATTALASALALSAVSATGGVIIPADFANDGKYAWELAGLSSDPGGFFDVKGVTTTAATDTAGTITLNLKYYLD